MEIFQKIKIIENRFYVYAMFLKSETHRAAQIIMVWKEDGENKLCGLFMLFYNF